MDKDQDLNAIDSIEQKHTELLNHDINLINKIITLNLNDEEKEGREDYETCLRKILEEDAQFRRNHIS